MTGRKAAMGEKRSITIREVALRDGLQSHPRFVPTEDKLTVLSALADAGVRTFETTSFVSPNAIPQLRDAAELMAKVPRETITHDVLVPNLKGARRAVAAGADRLIVFISASEAHNRANVNRGIEASLSDLDGIFQLASESGTAVGGAVAVSFGCPFQGNVPVADVLGIARHFIDRGAGQVGLADTTGMANPLQVSDMVDAFGRRFPDTELVLHLHNNRGTAMVNLMAGLEAGVRTFDTAAGGVGGCPNVPQAAGNLPTEDVVYLLDEMGYDTGIDLVKLIDAAKLLEAMLGVTLPGQVMKSGPRR
jgi:hydroxymethylglutaryl-CoA lyase